MICRVLWQAGLVSPAILWVAFTTSASTLAFEQPTRTVAIQPQAANSSLTADSLMIASTSPHKLENSAVIDTETRVLVAQGSNQANQSDVLKPLNPYSNQSSEKSLDQVKNDAQRDTSVTDADASEPSILDQIKSYSNESNDNSLDADASEPSILDQIKSYSNESNDNSLDQVTNVTQLSDVQPNDWAYEALRSLVERYGCIAGYPDRTYRGNRAMTRYEFAAGLNACLNQIERLITASTADLVRRQDLESLQRLVQEFQVELRTLGSRVDKLEDRVAFLEEHQFSTTTKLTGEVVLGIAGVASGNTVNGNNVSQNTVLGDRIRLNLDTSFTGKDLLRTRLQAVNLDAFSGNATYTPEGDLRFAGAAFESGNNNSVGIDALLYQFPIGEKTTVVLEANAGAIDDFINTVNPYLDGDGGSGALSHFGTRNPIYYLLNGTGLGLTHEFNDNLALSLGYLANDPANPEDDGGLFNGPYGAIAQITFKPIDKFSLGLTYVHAYNNDFTANGSTGSNRANLPSALLNNENLPAALQPFQGLNLPTSTNAYGVQASFQVSPQFMINGWAGYTTTRTLTSLEGTDGTVLERGDYDTWNFAVNLAFPDLGKKGNLAGIIFGMEPKVTSASRSLRNAIGKDSDTSLHIEAFYQYQVTENISITPGIIWLTAPDHNANNDDLVIGTIRTTFTF